jgi:hypothetical protein
LRRWCLKNEERNGLAFVVFEQKNTAITNKYLVGVSFSHYRRRALVCIMGGGHAPQSLFLWLLFISRAAAQEQSYMLVDSMECPYPLLNASECKHAGEQRGLEWQGVHHSTICELIHNHD